MNSQGHRRLYMHTHTHTHTHTHAHTHTCIRMHMYTYAYSQYDYCTIPPQARINRPGAKTFEYSSGGPQFGQYRAPPKNIMKDVRDKYKFKKFDQV